MYTIDSSVWVNGFDRREPGHDTSRQLLDLVAQRAIPIIVPILVLVEVAAAISIEDDARVLTAIQSFRVKVCVTLHSSLVTHHSNLRTHGANTNSSTPNASEIDAPMIIAVGALAYSATAPTHSAPSGMPPKKVML